MAGKRTSSDKHRAAACEPFPCPMEAALTVGPVTA
jgi:hypothetical protein